MDEEHVSQYLRSASALGEAINTDDNSNLEYATPFEFLDRTKPIIQALKPFAGFDRSRIGGADAADLRKSIASMPSDNRNSSMSSIARSTKSH